MIISMGPNLKQIVILLFIFCFNILYIYPVSADDFTNGGFETGDFTGWTISPWGGAGYNYAVNTAADHSGTYGLQTAAWSSTPGTKGVRFYQNLSLTNIDTVDFWYKIIDLDGGVEFLELQIDTSERWNTSGPVGGWIHESVDVSGDSGYHDVEFVIWAEGAGPPTPLIELYLDDCELIASAGWSGKVNNVSNPEKVIGVSSIAKVMGVS